MKLIKKIICFSITLMLVIGMTSPLSVHAAGGNKDVDADIGELISYYRDYQGQAETDILRVLDEIKEIDESKYNVWSQIMDFWTEVNSENFVNIGVLPDGLPQDNSMCIVILGFALHENGTMKQELIDRLQVGLDSANKYPEAYVVVTGGGTATMNPNVTEGELMAEWLLDHGLSKDRLIVENKAPSTVGNAINTYKILSEQYPQVKSLAMVTSDYHVPRGSILFFSQCLLSAYDAGKTPLKMISNAGCDTGSKGYESIELQANNVANIANVKLPSKRPLSKLDGLEITQEHPYVVGEKLNLTIKAFYNSNYTRNITDLIKVEGFDPTKGPNQKVTISYNENNHTITTDFDLSKTIKTVYDNTYLKELIKEVENKDLSIYTQDSVIKVRDALNHAKRLIELGDEVTKKEWNDAYDQINNALNHLVKLVNIAYKMNVNANCNQEKANIIDDGVKDRLEKGYYWESVENGKNIASNKAELTIDLDGLYKLDKIIVYPYWGGERVYQYELYGSKDNKNWIKIGENMSEEYVSENGIAHEIHNKDSFAYIKLKGVKTRVVGRDDINNIHICEIEVFGNETNNLAYLKPVTSSGTDTSAESSKNSKDKQIVDGDRQTYWDAGKYSKSPWAIVDLQDVYLLDKLNVITYWSGNDRYYYYDIYTSIDGNDYTLLSSKSSGKDKSTIFGDDIQIKQPCYARYVKIVGKYNSKNPSFHINELRVYGNEVTEYANYSLVDNAINKVPKDLSLYTADSVKELQNALDAVVRDKKIYDQAIVDEYAKNIELALTKLVYQSADYSKVDELIHKVPKDLSLYTAESVKELQDAIVAIERNLDISMQSKVDAMAYSLEKALDNLVRIEVSNTQSNENNTQVNTSDNYYPMMFMMVSMISGLSIVLLKKRKIN